jgi:hypothetical protein
MTTTYPLPVRPWRVTTTQGTVEVMAATLQHAILSGLELAGPGACLVRCVREGEW